jgi:hypothetical protein
MVVHQVVAELLLLPILDAARAAVCAFASFSRADVVLAEVDVVAHLAEVFARLGCHHGVQALEPV